MKLIIVYFGAFVGITVVCKWYIFPDFTYPVSYIPVSRMLCLKTKGGGVGESSKRQTSLKV